MGLELVGVEHAPANTHRSIRCLPTILGSFGVGVLARQPLHVEERAELAEVWSESFAKWTIQL